MVEEIEIMGDKIRVGRHDGRIHQMLYGNVLLPEITYNMESTTNNDMGGMEMIQGKMFRSDIVVTTRMTWRPIRCN